MSDLQEGESLRLWMVQYPGGRICGGVFHVTRGRGGSKSMLLSMENPLSKDFVPKAESQQSRPCHWAGISHLNGQRGCHGWKIPELIAFIKRRSLFVAEPDGCAFNLTDRAGVPHQQKWRIATSSYRLAKGLDAHTCKRPSDLTFEIRR